MVGVTVAATLAAGVLIGAAVAAPGAGQHRAAEAATDRRQVQFDTPGGTRIIWVIDPDFDL